MSASNTSRAFPRPFLGQIFIESIFVTANSWQQQSIKVKKILEDLSGKFYFQVCVVWITLCFPANIMTLVYYNQEVNGTRFDEESLQEDNATNITLQCHESKEDWDLILDWSKYLIQGVSVTVIGILGFIANVLSVIVLLKCKHNRNFHRLLAGMAVVDSILIAVIVMEISVIGVFLEREPHWYILAYPYFIHPVRGMIQTLAIFMVVAVATERYR